MRELTRWIIISIVIALILVALARGSPGRRRAREPVVGRHLCPRECQLGAWKGGSARRVSIELSIILRLSKEPSKYIRNERSARFATDDRHSIGPWVVGMGNLDDVIPYILI